MEMQTLVNDQVIATNEKLGESPMNTAVNVLRNILYSETTK